MNNPGLFDGSFAHAKSATYGGDNIGLGPKHFVWMRNQIGSNVTFYTDMCLDLVKEHKGGGLKVAWLLEPPSLSDTHYKKAIKLEDQFDYILTFMTDLLEKGEKWLYYPLGGSWIAEKDWGTHRKHRMVSIIGTDKYGALGHNLRHSIIKQFGDRLTVWGRGYNPIDSKYLALASYRYSIVVESIKTDDYFSEKLIDCLSMGTIPIYWGSPTITDHFHSAGIIQFDYENDLPDILDSLSERDYEIRYQAAIENLVRAEQYACAEDWIYNHYPVLFGVHDE